jgi:hypothetical protein
MLTSSGKTGGVRVCGDSGGWVGGGEDGDSVVYRAKNNWGIRDLYFSDSKSAGGGMRFKYDLCGGGGGSAGGGVGVGEGWGESWVVTRLKVPVCADSASRARERARRNVSSMIVDRRSVSAPPARELGLGPCGDGQLVHTLKRRPDTMDQRMSIAAQRILPGPVVGRPVGILWRRRSEMSTALSPSAFVGNDAAGPTGKAGARAISGVLVPAYDRGRAGRRWSRREAVPGGGRLRSACVGRSRPYAMCDCPRLVLYDETKIRSSLNVQFQLTPGVFSLTVRKNRAGKVPDLGAHRHSRGGTRNARYRAGALRALWGL